LAGGGIRGGAVVGESDPNGGKEPKDRVPVADLHATVMKALGIDWEAKLNRSGDRTVRRSEGKPIEGLLG
jgi:hypothetical protein